MSASQRFTPANQVPADMEKDSRPPCVDLQSVAHGGGLKPSVRFAVAAGHDKLVPAYDLPLMRTPRHRAGPLGLYKMPFSNRSLAFC